MPSFFSLLLVLLAALAVILVSLFSLSPNHMPVRTAFGAYRRIYPIALTHHIRTYFFQKKNIGGAYDTVPEVAILLALFNFSDNFYKTVFDEAGQFFSSLPTRPFTPPEILLRSTISNNSLLTSAHSSP